MPSTATPLRRIAARATAFLALIWLAACEPTGMSGGGPRIDPDAPVQVALLVPNGSGNQTDALLARNFENAARLAIADLQGAQIDLRVYPTGASDQGAANAATQAINDGAKILLGPLYAGSAAAAGIAAAPSGTNVLAFSNNPDVAGGNVFILGATFDSAAERLVGYGMRHGLTRYMIVYSDDNAGRVGRDAIAGAIGRASAEVAGQQGYPLSQQGILSAVPGITNQIDATGANAVFTTANVAADLPALSTGLYEQGALDGARLLGLTRWDAAPQALSQPGLQGGLFALPDQSTTAAFESRYQARYGQAPHPLAGLAYDGIAAIGALVARGDANALSRGALTQGQGFSGTSGIFRLNRDGTNTRGLAVAEIRNNRVNILEPAPRSFGGAGF